MSWYLAPSLHTLREQINTLWPGRDRTSDGSIGDASHGARVSDHNPDYQSGGVVRAIDIDEDGIHAATVLRCLERDSRVSYIIYEGSIWGGTRWRPYTGANAHTQHIHVSLKHTADAEDPRAWTLGRIITPAASVTPTAPTTVEDWFDMATQQDLTDAVNDALNGFQVKVIRPDGDKYMALPTYLRWLDRTLQTTNYEATVGRQTAQAVAKLSGISDADLALIRQTVEQALAAGVDIDVTVTAP